MGSYGLQVRIFNAEIADDLEEELNGWLKKQDAAYVRDIRFHILPVESPWRYTAMVVYEVEKGGTATHS